MPIESGRAKEHLGAYKKISNGYRGDSCHLK